MSDVKGNRRAEAFKLNISKRKTIYTYLCLFAMVLSYHAFSVTAFSYLVPLFLYGVPIYFQRTVRLRFDVKDIAKGFAVTAVLLVPFLCYLLIMGQTVTLVPFRAVIFQLFVVALPEEIYFRGFLQERFGNNVQSVIMVSILFSIMHLPQFIMYNDIYAILTVFPSLVMGVLYMWTGNIITPTIFHVAANIVFLSCCTVL